MKQFLDSDYYLHHPKKVAEMKKWGVESIPVDLNSCFVPTDKTDFKGNFSSMQACRDRKVSVGGGGEDE
jgi:hypothetical protein